MRFIGCDRCKAIFPAGTRHTKLRIFDTTHDEIEDDGAPPFETKELCPVCRTDLDAFLAGTDVDLTAAEAQARTITPIDDELPDDQDEPPTHRRQAEKRTCESCGHTGFRKFQKTDTGWCCWRCIDTQKRQLTPPAGDEAESDADPEPEPPSAPAPAPAPAAVTERCRDCTRTWTLTGFVLEKAAEMHELKHGHIVNILEPAGAA